MMQAGEATTAGNTQLVLEFLEAIDRQQLEAIERVLGPEFRLFLGGKEHDREQLLTLIRSVHAAFSDFRHEVQETFAIEDRVIVRMIDRGLHTGPFEGIPATGRPISINQISIVRLADGKITEIREEADLLGLMQQIGAFPIGD